MFDCLKRALNRPVYALPVDAFRILVGFLSFSYFLRTFLEVEDFSSPHGLIDHKLLQEIFWFTRLSLFQYGMGEVLFRLAHLLAMFASLMLSLGIRVKPAAVTMYVIAVSAYRWNGLVAYIEDGVMHLLLFWMILLPVGETLGLWEWMAKRRDALQDWKNRVVTGASVRLFLGNLALVYVVSGLWKWTSPMWRHGTALYVILKLPVSYAPDFWSLHHLSVLKVINYMALITEPLLALLILLPANHVLKWFLLPFMLGFHVGIIATMKLPFANVGMIAALVLVFRDELMQFVHKDARLDFTRACLPYKFSEKLAIFFFTCLVCQMIADIRTPYGRPPTIESRTSNERLGKEQILAGVLRTNPFYVPLWTIGIAQSYRLFDWIDDRNFVFHYIVLNRNHGLDPEPINPVELFPSSARSLLLQTYLHGEPWMKIPESRLRELKISIYTRAAERYCRNHGPSGPIDVYATVHRVRAESSSTSQELPKFLIEFECHRKSPMINNILL